MRFSPVAVVLLTAAVDVEPGGHLRLQTLALIK
jgi:hypothetical protein